MLAGAWRSGRSHPRIIPNRCGGRGRRVGVPATYERLSSADYRKGQQDSNIRWMGPLASEGRGHPAKLHMLPAVAHSYHTR